MAFIGLHNYISITKHDSNFAYVVTNKRFMIAQKRLIGEVFQTISLDNVNDITLKKGLALGIITVDTIKETFNIAINKKIATNINVELNNILDNIRKISKGNTIVQSNNTTNTTDEIMKYKNLLDVGAITQEEYELKKKQLLAL